MSIVVNGMDFDQLVEEVKRLREQLEAGRKALGTEAVRTHKPKRQAKATSAKPKAAGKRGRAPKFSNEDAQKMAEQRAAGATYAKLAVDWKAAVPTIMKTLARLNGVRP